ncbi:glycosyltransferase family 2 protein [Paraburkholderia sp. RL17-337-BIB-A]|uniref:glycosyltransferase family 2 protein n=1 Tax=Paraburkholderia sp. RL17-337-BIB-A TaxID=3031636 RepID=UPI0038B74E9C
MKIDAHYPDLSVAHRISVVVLTHNRAKEVMHTLSRLLALPEQPEVFVADNASMDGTVGLIKAGLRDVRVVQCPSRLCQLVEVEAERPQQRAPLRKRRTDLG